MQKIILFVRHWYRWFVLYLTSVQGILQIYCCCGTCQPLGGKLIPFPLTFPGRGRTLYVGFCTHTRLKKKELNFNPIKFSLTESNVIEMHLPYSPIVLLTKRYNLLCAWLGWDCFFPFNLWYCLSWTFEGFRINDLRASVLCIAPTKTLCCLHEKFSSRQISQMKVYGKGPQSSDERLGGAWRCRALLFIFRADELTQYT